MIHFVSIYIRIVFVLFHFLALNNFLYFIGSMDEIMKYAVLLDWRINRSYIYTSVSHFIILLWFCLQIPSFFFRFFVILSTISMAVNIINDGDRSPRIVLREPTGSTAEVRCCFFSFVDAFFVRLFVIITELLALFLTFYMISDSFRFCWFDYEWKILIDVIVWDICCWKLWLHCCYE